MGQGRILRRRTFLQGVAALCGGAVLRGLAQEPKAPLVGLLSARSPEESAHLMAAFRRGLGENGYVEGRNVAIEYRWAFGDYGRLPALAAELARLPLAAIAAVGGEPATLAAKAATSKIPIAGTFGSDPVASGVVASLRRPGGNITGTSNLSFALEPKRLGLLRELFPKARELGVLLNPAASNVGEHLKTIQQAAHASGLQLRVLKASTDRELDAAFRSIGQHRVGALLVISDPFFNSRRDKLVPLAARAAVPTMYSFRDYAVAGGLMSYGIDLRDIYRQIGVLVGRILKGAKPGDLPVQQPTKFEFVINLRAAKMLGFKVPPTILDRADEVIE